jgi:glycerophosphoryl diester phosphodiesterase
MIWAVIESLKSSWRSLVLVDLAFKIIGFVLLAPLVSLVFRGFLAASGRTVLADVDMVRFLLHPIGWLTLIVVGGATIGILALEQSAMMTISLGAARGRRISVLSALLFVAARARGILEIAGRMVARLLLLVAPFLALGYGIYWLLLSGHDINFYLTEQPPRFWIAGALAAALLVVLAFLLVQCVVSWAVAVQLHLFEDLPAGQCLAESRRRVLGHRKAIAGWVVTWFVVNLLIELAANWLFIAIAKAVVPAAASVSLLALTLGLVLVAWGALQLLLNTLAVKSFAVLQGHVYDDLARGDHFHLPEAAQATAWAPRLTRGRLVSALAIGLVASTLVGALAIDSVRLEDRVLVTAHRGSSARAPENTLAAVRAAIEDRADFVEIDVQESKDGQVLVVHDSDLKKVSGQALRIWENTADELRAVDVGSFLNPKFHAERVPTLAEVLAACKGTIGVNIELKHYGHQVDLERRVVDIVDEHDMADEIVIMSLDRASIAKVKQLRPQWRVGLLTAVAVGDLTREQADFLAVNTQLATQAFIRAVHRQDRQVYVWTVNDPVLMSRLISRGVDNLITDKPDVARRVLAERASMSPVERVLLELAHYFGVTPRGSAEQ